MQLLKRAEIATGIPHNVCIYTAHSGWLLLYCFDFVLLENVCFNPGLWHSFLSLSTKRML
jgi:hypothetical protein